MRYQHRLYLCLLVCSLLLIGGCTPPPGYADVQATAQAAGCWPGNAPTPNPVTVTPQRPAPQPSGTALPTTTPYPRCPAVPGAALTPWPTPARPPKPYPTMEPARSRARSDAQTTFQLPGQTYQLDLAVHPTENWPAVALMQRWGLSTDGTQVFVRVFNSLADEAPR